MKVRKGFVSNSSSSSFVCDITGGIESGMDASLSDFEMVECENNHLFYKTYLINNTEYYDLIEKIRNDGDIDEDMLYGYNIPSKFCPICHFDVIMEKQAVKYLLKTDDITMEELKVKIQNQFSTYTEFQKWLDC